MREGLKEEPNLKIRLIDPAYDHPFISHTQKVIKKIWFARLTLTTLAAITPPDVDVRITDENVEPIDFEEDVDLVGITGMVLHLSLIHISEPTRPY